MERYLRERKEVIVAIVVDNYIDEMQIGVTEFYLEPGYAFNISFKVNGLIKRKLTAEYASLKNKKDLPGECDLQFQVSTGPDIKEPYIGEKTHIDYRYKYFTYYLYLPYKEIKSSQDEQQAYIDYMFAGIKDKLCEFGFNPEQLIRIKEEIKKEVKNNSEYIPNSNW